MYSTASRLTNTPLAACAEQLPPSNGDGGKIVFPEALTFKTLDGARFTVIKIDDLFTIKDLAESLYQGGGNSTRAFPTIELGRSFNFSFNGRCYPAHTRLSAVHEEINLNACVEVEYRKTDARIAADQLKSGTGIEWRVLNENEVMFDSDPCEKQEQAAAFAESVLKKIPHLARIIDVQINRMGMHFHVTMRVANSHSIRMIAQGIPPEISLAAPLIAQAVRTGDAAGLGMLPLDVLSRLGMYLAPEIPDIQACGAMKAEIDHASQEYVEAPYFREVAPVAAEGISASIAATATLLLRGVEKNARVFDARISDAGLTLYFSDALHAGKFIRAMKQAGYQAACLQWMQPNETNGGCAATIFIRDFNEVKRFVETTCGFARASTVELFGTVGNKNFLPDQFFIKELEQIGESHAPTTLDHKKAAARRLIQDYLPYLDPAKAGELSKAIEERSRPDENGNTGSLQYLREKRGLGRTLSINVYSDNVATYREMMAAIAGLIPKTSCG